MGFQRLSSGSLAQGGRRSRTESSRLNWFFGGNRTLSTLHHFATIPRLIQFPLFGCANREWDRGGDPLSDRPSRPTPKGALRSLWTGWPADSSRSWPAGVPARPAPWRVSVPLLELADELVLASRRSGRSRRLSNWPHFSLTLPLNCFQLPSISSQFMLVLLSQLDVDVQCDHPGLVWFVLSPRSRAALGPMAAILIPRFPS